MRDHFTLKDSPPSNPTFSCTITGPKLWHFGVIKYIVIVMASQSCIVTVSKLPLPVASYSYW